MKRWTQHPPGFYPTEADLAAVVVAISKLEATGHNEMASDLKRTYYRMLPHREEK